MKRTALPTALPTALAASVLLLAGCSGSDGGSGSGGGAAAAPSPSVNTYGCLSQEQAAKGSFGLQASGGAGGTLDAYYRDSDAGHATTAVVLSHQLGGSLCEWTPYLDAFTKAGYAVLPFTCSGDVTDGISAAAGYLKTKGVTRIVLIGASKGGAASLVAGKLDSPLPIAAIVTLSSPEAYGQFNAALAVKVVKAPILFAAEQGDSPFNQNAQSLYDASVSAQKQIKLYPGSNHGAGLLTDGAMPDVQAFLAKNAPAAG